MWTLWFEATCYAVLALAGVCGLFNKGRFPTFLLWFGVTYAAIELRILPIHPAYAYLGLPFVLGMTAYHYRQMLPLNWRLTAALFLVAVLVPTEPLWTLALGYAALWMGGLNTPRLNRYNQLGDYSYGTYIYGWPIQQMVALLIPSIGPMLMMAIALPVAWCLGAISWYLVEHPSINGAGALLRLKAFAGDAKAEAP